jgi:hypothetical protein
LNIFAAAKNKAVAHHEMIAICDRDDGVHKIDTVGFMRIPRYGCGPGTRHSVLDGHRRASGIECDLVIFTELRHVLDIAFGECGLIGTQSWKQGMNPFPENLVLSLCNLLCAKCLKLAKGCGRELPGLVKRFEIGAIDPLSRRDPNAGLKAN